MFTPMVVSVTSHPHDYYKIHITKENKAYIKVLHQIPYYMNNKIIIHIYIHFVMIGNMHFKENAFAVIRFVHLVSIDQHCASCNTLKRLFNL